MRDMSNGRPTNSAEGRLWNYWNRVDFYRIHNWPWRVREAALRGGNRNRLYLYVFLVGNGMAPWQATELMQLAPWALDGPARQQLVQFARNANTLVRRYNYFDMHTQTYSGTLND